MPDPRTAEERLRAAAETMLQGIDHRQHEHPSWPSSECDECLAVRKSRADNLRAALAAEPVPVPEDEPRCAECGNGIMKHWRDGIEQPWKHWVEPVPDGHAAIRQSPSIDVERLAEAIEGLGERDIIGGQPQGYWKIAARNIAAEYAALATPPEPKP